MFPCIILNLGYANRHGWKRNFNNGVKRTHWNFQNVIIFHGFLPPIKINFIVLWSHTSFKEITI